jgi:hypothetical protein
MDHGDLIRKHLTGTPSDQSRQEELLQALLDAFSTGGEEAVAAVLKRRLDELERAFDQKLNALDPLLS